MHIDLDGFAIEVNAVDLDSKLLRTNETVIKDVVLAVPMRFTHYTHRGMKFLTIHAKLKVEDGGYIHTFYFADSTLLYSKPESQP